MTNTKGPRVSAVVLTWNTAGFAIQTLESLAEGFAEGLRIVLVDNGSVDDSVAVIKGFLAGWPNAGAVTLIESPENLGFPGGVNLGTARALAADPPPEYIWMLNPDAVVGPDTARELVAAAEESGAGIVGVAGRGKYLPPNAWPRAFFLPVSRLAKARPLDGDWWPAARYGGSCALFRASLVRDLIARDGHFQNASLFLDWDEWECTRRAAHLGARVVLSAHAREHHDDAGRTLGPSPMARARQYYQSRNAIVVGRRYMSPWLFWSSLPLHLARDLSWFLRLRVGGARPNERAYLAGALDGVRGKVGRWKHHPVTPHANR